MIMSELKAKIPELAPILEGINFEETYEGDIYILKTTSAFTSTSNAKNITMSAELSNLGYVWAYAKI